MAFGLHYKNWVNMDEENFRVRSGIYSQKIPLSQIKTVDFVPKIPKMERKSGFSWWVKEKGVFRDSISGQTVHVFIDDLRQQKIKLVYQDSLLLYFNVADSVKTLKFYTFLNNKATLKK